MTAAESDELLTEEDLEHLDRDELESEVRALRDRVAALEEQIEALPDIEYRGEEDMVNLWIDDLPVGQLINNNRARAKDVEDRVHAIEKGEVDPGDVVAEAAGPNVEDLMQLHQKYLEATNFEHTEHDLSSNKEIAARTFPHLFDRMVDSGHGHFTLTSSEVERIITEDVATPELAERLDVEDPYSTTVNRVIRHIEKFTPEWISVDRDSHPMQIHVDKEQYRDYCRLVADMEAEGDGQNNDVVTRR